MSDSLSKIYQLRFSGQEVYRNAIWQILVRDFFSKWIKKTPILDLDADMVSS